MNPWWSFALTALGLLGIYLSGKKNYWGWGLGVISQIVWVVYAIATKQWGFILSAFAYGFFYAKNFISWRNEKKDNGS